MPGTETLDVLVVASRRDSEIAVSALRNLDRRMPFRGRTFLVMQDQAAARAVIDRAAVRRVADLADRDFLSAAELRLDGWYRQQLIKLRAGRVLAGASYVVLSGDALLLRKIAREELIERSSGRPYLYVTRYRYPARHLAFERRRVNAVARLLGVDPDRSRLLGDFISDLFCFERGVVAAALDRLRDRLGPSWSRLFAGAAADAGHRGEFGEYTLYAVVALDCGLVPPPVRMHWQTHVLQIHGREALSRARFDAAVLHIVDKNLPMSEIAARAARHGVQLLVPERDRRLAAPAGPAWADPGARLRCLAAPRQVSAPRRGPALAGLAGRWIFLLGIPGAGKTTLARTLESTTGAHYVSSSSLLRASKRYGKHMAQFSTGRMPDPQLIAGLVVAELRRADRQLPAVIDGFPRTWSQYLALNPEHGAERAGMIFVWVEVDVRLAARRLEWRRVCRDCGRPAPMTDTSRSCAACGGLVRRRPDDVRADAAARIHAHGEQLADLRTRLMEVRNVCSINGAEPPDANVARIAAFAGKSELESVTTRGEWGCGTRC